MDPKKTKKADLSNYSFLFFNIGLATSLTLAIFAFNYKVYDDTSVKEIAQTKSIIDDLIEPPPTEQPPPPPVKIEQAQFIEIPDEKKIEEEIKMNLDIETHMDQRVAEVIPPPAVIEEEKEDPHQIFVVVEESAVPIGGIGSFYTYVRDRLKYPAQARRMRIEGKVFVQFIVEKDGSIASVEVVKGIGAGCDEEAIRVVEGAPKWKPAKQRGRPVRQRMVLPITFKLADS